MMTRPFPTTRRAALGLIGAALVVPRPALAGVLARLTGRAFATKWRLIAPAGDLSHLGPEIEALFARIDGQFSPWKPESEICLFNTAGRGLHPAGPDLVEVTQAALRISRQTEGAFDPTVGPLVAARGFGPISAGGAPDWRGIEAVDGRIGKARGDLTLDLCGIAKGWALDRAADLVRDHGHRDFLFELGGEFRASGRHPDGRDWRVAVEAPAPDRPALATLRLPEGAAVATSGTRAQSYALGGRLYSHIIGPAFSAEGHRSVTVIAADAMAADGWATALCAAGPAQGPEIARAHHVSALFLTEADGTTREKATGDMASMLL